MTHFYLDASAIIKYYSPEVGSHWVTDIVDDTTTHTVSMSEITLAEVAAGLAAKARAPQGISVEQRNRALSRFLQDCDERYQLIEVRRSIIDMAVMLTQKHKLRGYDAVQLATAMSVNVELVQHRAAPFTFTSADDDLLAAAKVEGLEVENPNTHP